MGIDTMKAFLKAAAIVMVTSLALLGPVAGTLAEETMPVTCYRAGSRIGTVTVFNWRAAASTCNMVLYDCKGECIGCFRDNDYVDDVCIDTRGNEFLR